MVVVEMDDGPERLTIVETILDRLRPGEGRDSALNPRVPSDAFRMRQTEVFHQAQGLGMRSEIGMQETVRTRILVRIRKRQLVAEWVFLKKSERMSEADVVIRLGQESGTDQVRSEHDEQIVACAGVTLSRFLSEHRSRRNHQQSRKD